MRTATLGVALTATTLVAGAMIPVQNMGRSNEHSAVAKTAARHEIATSAAALAVREPGAVGEWFDSGELVKRLNVAIYTSILNTVGTFASGACLLAFTGNAPAAIGCGVSTLAYVMLAAYALWKNPPNKARGIEFYTDVPSMVTFTYAREEGQLASDAMALAYEASGSKEPIIAMHHNCETVGCYNYHYSNYEHETIGTVHIISQRPRGEWALPAVASRGYKTNVDGSHQEHTKGGTPIYGDYFWWDVDPSVTKSATDGITAEQFADAIYEGAAQQSNFKYQGSYCTDIIDNSDSGAIGSTGFFDVHEGGAFTPPARESEWLTDCYADAEEK